MSYYLLVKLDFARFRVDNVWIYVVLPFGQTFGQLEGVLAGVWIYVVLPFGQTWSSRAWSGKGLNICRITFWSNFKKEKTIVGLFEYMSYYLLVKLGQTQSLHRKVWIYVVLPFGQTASSASRVRVSLNICRITFWSNSRSRRTSSSHVWIYVVLPFGQTLCLTKRLHINVFKLFFVVKKRQ